MFAIQFLCYACLATSAAAQQITREITFELTYQNRDLVWLGDPASPAALVYPKPGAQPVATDIQVTTRRENHQSPARQYHRDARIVLDNNARQVRAFTSQREQLVGTIDDQGRFAPNTFYHDNRALLPTWPDDVSQLRYDANENTLYRDVAVTGPVITVSLDFLPLQLSDANGNAVAGTFSLNYVPSQATKTKSPAMVSLVLQCENSTNTLAQATVPNTFRREDVQLGSYDNQAGTYFQESNYRVGADLPEDAMPSVTFTFPGNFTPSANGDGEKLIVTAPAPRADQPKPASSKIKIDGNFDDWRNIVGIDDPRGDLVPYLEYVPDVDLLEFKVAHDDEHIYLYARVAGQVGRTHPDGGRGYFYAYMDVDQNAGTGFLPTRDDECYFGVNIGDDCEVQFEFVNNSFRKSFYGFCGLGGDQHVLNQTLTLGKSQYGRLDANGVERAHYKSEYTYREGAPQITEDLKLGTSDTIHLAVSLDGSEVEIASKFSGFLKDATGRPIVGPGQTIDLAAGMECDSKLFPGKTQWAADNTVPIRGYRMSR
ncbi:MAG: hypothetical protein SGJ19_23070 [Planctomycetia bacterium]|nr:hypothetical protein [Planctomycetia bacterium]